MQARLRSFKLRSLFCCGNSRMIRMGRVCGRANPLTRLRGSSPEGRAFWLR